MSNEKPVDPLAFLSPRLRAILSEFAQIERRTDIQQLVWMIETYVPATINPRAAESTQGRRSFVHETTVRRVPGQAAEIDGLPAPGENSGPKTPLHKKE